MFLIILSLRNFIVRFLVFLRLDCHGSLIFFLSLDFKTRGDLFYGFSWLESDYVSVADLLVLIHCKPISCICLKFKFDILMFDKYYTHFITFIWNIHNFKSFTIDVSSFHTPLDVSLLVWKTGSYVYLESASYLLSLVVYIVDIFHCDTSNVRHESYLILFV